MKAWQVYGAADGEPGFPCHPYVLYNVYSMWKEITKGERSWTFRLREIRCSFLNGEFRLQRGNRYVRKLTT